MKETVSRENGYKRERSPPPPNPTTCSRQHLQTTPVYSQSFYTHLLLSKTQITMKTLIAALFISLGAVFASPTTNSNSLPALPQQDGLYLGSVDEAGQFSWIFHGKADTQAPATRDSAPSLAKRSGAHCNGYPAGSVDDINAAVQAIKDGCHETHYDKAIAFQRGGVVAFGCNYGGGQSCNGYEIAPFFTEVASVCGEGNAGWYSKSEWAASYGYTRAGNGFC